MSNLQAAKRLLTFPFSDPNWKNKFLIGSGLAFGGFIIPVLPHLPLLGYGARMIRKATAGDADETYTLPEWDDWNELFLEGLRLFGVGFILNLPVTLLMLVGWGMYMASTFSITMAQNNPGQMAEAIPMFFAGFGAFWCSLALGALLMGFTYIVMPAAQAHVAIKRSFGASFAVREWWPIVRANIGGYLMILFILMGLYMVFAVSLQILYATIVLCFFFPLILSPLMFYGMLVFYHLSGLAYAEGQANLALADGAAGGEMGEPAVVL